MKSPITDFFSFLENVYLIISVYSQIFDDLIFTFFAVEMLIKVMAMGFHGKGTYLAESWNRLDFFIVVAG